MESAFCKIQWLSVVIATLVFVGCEDVHLESEDTIKKSFQVGPGGRLTLETDRGSIEVRAVDSNTLEVEVNRKVYALDRAKADEILKDFDIEFTQRGNDLHIRGEFKRPRPSFWGWRRPRLRLHYLVSVPKKYNVDLKTAGGSILIDDLEGEVHSKTSGGSISIGEVDGDIVVHTSGGSIRIDRATGSVMAKTSGGSITVEEVMGEIEARTSGGSVKAYITRQPQKNCLLRTSGGNVVVYLADNIAVDVDAETSGGYIKTELPITVQGKVGRTKLQGKMNGGGPELFLRTSGGNIHLRSL